MSKLAAFQGTFSDFRIVKGRKVVQFVIEVATETGNAALQALGGIPDPANPVWVAVARIDPKAAEEPKQLPAPEKERKKWEAMPPSQQAAIRCGEEEFREFLYEKHEPCGAAWQGAPDPEAAAACVRLLCGVNSRSDLNNDHFAAERWHRLQDDFWAWQRGMH